MQFPGAIQIGSQYIRTEEQAGKDSAEEKNIGIPSTLGLDPAQPMAAVADQAHMRRAPPEASGRGAGSRGGGRGEGERGRWVKVEAEENR